MPITRLSNLNVTVFTLGGTAMIADLENATVSISVDSEDAKGIADEWSHAWALAKSWTIEGESFVPDTGAGLVIDVANGDALVTVAYTSGGNTYSGTAVIKSVSHSTSRASLQKQKFSLEGQGALTVVSPS